jgi:undecaprenyl-diphosphatase
MGPQDTYARLALLLIIATIPAGLIGLVFQKRLQLLFGSPKIVAVVLIFNGLLLYSIELFKQQRMRRENLRIVGDVAIVKMTWLAALGTGLMQSLALIPGFSRTGSSLAGGLLAGLDRESAARFSFLLATPIIFAAAALKLPELLKVHDYPVAQIGVGALAAGIGAFISASFLTRYFKTNTLRPFAIYCIVAGLILVYLLTR